MNPFPFPLRRPLAWLSLVTLAIGPVLRAQRMDITDPSAKPVVVETAEVSTEITGRIAVTTFDLVFHNPNSRVLEGTFVLPLLDGQSIVRFALDIGGALREAVPVDKTRGRVVFEEIERRRVDPGLLEQTAGNNYRARVFPLPAHGTRRIVIACQEELAPTVGGPTYRLNLDFPDVLKRFRLAVHAHTGRAEPAVRTTLGLELPPWRPEQVIETVRENFLARGLLEIELPELEHPSVLTGEWDGEEYFYAEAQVDLPPQPRHAPRVVGLLWDSSGSGSERDHGREFALLDAWFQTLRNVDIRLVRLRDEAGAAAAFAIQGGDWSTLKAELEKTDYDGATSLDGLADDPAVEEWILFSDGLVNYGVTLGASELPVRGVVHTVLASPRADPTWLRGLAARHGGEFVNLLETPPGVAAGRLRVQSPRVLSMDYHHDEAAEIYPEPGLPVGDGPLVITGRLRGQTARVRMRIGTDQRHAQDIEIVARSRENATLLAARGWAAAKISQLSLDPAANRADIRRTSREFGIVTADTSLIVLETVADYVRYDIAPPAELMSDWKNQRRSIATERRKDRDVHLESVVAAFQARLAWWERSFPKDDPVPEWLRKPSKTASLPLPRGSLSSPAPSNPAGLPIRDDTNDDEQIITLSPFEVTADNDTGYLASATLAGNRLQTNLRDLGSAISVVTTQTLAAAAPASKPAATITLQAWDPDAGYLNRLQRAKPDAVYAIYLEERQRNDRTPGFFLDVANFFFDRGDPALGRRVLSNLAELELEDVPLLRVLAHRLEQADRPDLALPLLERVLALRDDEPQSRRDLALVCAQLGQFQRAVDLLWEVASQPWSDRFPDIELIALTELNAIAATCGQPLDLSRVDGRLRKNLPVDTRVVLTWDVNDCDVDLWLTDPNAEKACYNHPLTYQGGAMSADCVAGYGPEEFLLRSAKPGTYRVEVDYFGDRRMTALGPVTAQIRVITDFGRPSQREKRTIVRLDHRKQRLDIGTFTVPATKTSSVANE